MPQYICAVRIAISATSKKEVHALLRSLFFGDVEDWEYDEWGAPVLLTTPDGHAFVPQLPGREVRST